MTFSQLYKTVRTRFKQQIVILSFFHMLERVGIVITPYYLTIESLPENLKIDSKLQPISFGFLGREEVIQLYRSPDFIAFSGEAKFIEDENYRCFGIRYNGEIVAYCWSGLSKFSSFLNNFKLNSDEAYLFNARTMPKYRGMNLAPVLRYNLYKQLSEIGRKKCYSTTEYFNKSALNFKSKLNAEHQSLYLYIRIFKIIKWNIKLKKYPQRN